MSTVSGSVSSYNSSCSLGSIFATPSVILRSSGSVGLSLIMWLLGATVALCGTAVYMELGTVGDAAPAYIRCSGDVCMMLTPFHQALPRNGGEKNYLEFIFRRPKLLVTCIYALYAVLTVCIPASLNRTIANTITD